MDLIWFVCAGGFAFEQNINYQSFLSSHLAVYNCLLIYFYLLVKMNENLIHSNLALVNFLRSAKMFTNCQVFTIYNVIYAKLKYG